MEIVSPSTVTLQFWLQRSNYRIRARHVAPHISLNFQPRAHPVRSSNQKLIRVAFLGTMAPHKGWPLFEQLSNDPSLANKFEFYLFNSARSSSGSVKHIKVQVNAENPTAMIDAVESNEIDFILHWPTWPETFSLTTYEALSGGAQVITNSISGNVAAAVNKYERGFVLDSERDLLNFLQSDQIHSLTEDARRLRARFKAEASSSDLSLPILQMAS